MPLEKFFETRRKEIELDGGSKAVVRKINTMEAFRVTGVVPGVDRVKNDQVPGSGEPVSEDGKPKMDPEEIKKVSDEMIRAALVSIDGEMDPLGRGLIEMADLTTKDREAILSGVMDLMPTRGKGADGEGVPLAGTASDHKPADSLTGSDSVTA